MEIPPGSVRIAHDFFKHLKSLGSNIDKKDAKQAFKLLGGGRGDVEKLQHMAKLSPQSVPLLTQVGTCTFSDSCACVHFQAKFSICFRTYCIVKFVTTNYIHTHQHEDMSSLQNSGGTVSLTQREISGLLATAAFCALQRPPDGDQLYKDANFDSLYSANMPEKLKCLHSYFQQRSEGKAPNSLVTFQRRILQ